MVAVRPAFNGNLAEHWGGGGVKAAMKGTAHLLSVTLVDKLN